MIAGGGEAPAFQEQPSGPSDCTKNVGEIDESYTPNGNTESQMRNDDDMRKINEHRLKKNWSGDVKLADVYVQLKNKYTKVLSNIAKV